MTDPKPLDLDSILASSLAQQASDIILKPGSLPTLRVNGRVQPLGKVPLPGGVLSAFFDLMATHRAHTLFESEGEVDFAFERPGLARFRVNAFRQMGQVGLVLRRINENIPSFQSLGLPEKVIQDLCKLQRGLVMVTGITGSGKSTSLAAMIDFMNETMTRHVVTIEDPVEFLHRDKKCIINQREVGLDTRSFSTAMKHVVRESPDVILIGEMRDTETMEAAIAAAETGHLVLSTLHTVNAVQTVERILNFFPPHQHVLIRQQIALVLGGIVSQRLLRRKDGQGRVPAVEIMLGTPTVKELLTEGKTTELTKAISEEHTYFGSQTFLQSLIDLIHNDLVDVEDAVGAADDPEELRMSLRGIRRGTRFS